MDSPPTPPVPMDTRPPLLPKKITARDVAERLGLSKWTVSRSFDDAASVAPEVRARVLAAAAEMGYVPNVLARSLSTRSTRLIGLVTDELENPNQLRLLNAATQELQAQGYSTLLLNLSGDYDAAAALRQAEQFQVDGIMFMGTTLREQLIELAQKIRHIPLVVLMRNSDQIDIPCVTTDGHAAGAEIADILLDQGHVRIGYLAGPVSERTELRRLEGFRSRLQARGSALAVVLSASHYRRDEALRAFESYLQAVPREQRVEAIFCENDILAIGVLDALERTGLRRRIAVMGFDDIDLAASPHFELSTFRQPVDLLVQEAVRRVLHPQQQAGARSLMVPGMLVLRGSHRRMT